MRRIIVAFTLLGLLVATSCSKNSTSTTMSTATALASDPLIQTLVSSLGLSAAQAIGGAGALLGLGQKNLAAADWSKVAGAIPGAKSLISQAKTLGGITQFTNLAGLAPSFTKMGLSSDQVKSLTPALTDYVGKAAGAEVGTLLAGAIK